MTSAMLASKEPDIPSEASCFVKDYASDDEVPDTAVCIPNEGLFLFRDKHVIDWCDIGEGTVTDMALFHTYHPFCKHYVLQFPSLVKIVSHCQRLQVTHSFDGVERFEISDFKNQGFPQVGLWRKGCEIPQITDLTTSFSPSCMNPVEIILSSKLQGLKMCVSKLRHQVDEKKRLRRLHSFSFIKSRMEELCQPNIQLVPLRDHKRCEDSCGNSLPSCLEVRESWQRLLCGRWVIGCDIINSGQSPMHGLALCVRAPPDGAPRGAPGGVGPPVLWSIMACGDSSALAWDCWRTLRLGEELQPGKAVCIVGVVSEPSFIYHRPYVELSGMVRASLPDGRAVTASVPRWRVSVEVVLNGSLQPFAGGASHPDLLACLAASCLQVVLRLEGRVGLLERVHEVLRGAGLRSLHPEEGEGHVALLVGRGPRDSPLHDALVIVRPLAATCCQLDLHLREPRHLFLLIHQLRAGLPAHSRVSVEQRAERPEQQPGLLQAQRTEQQPDLLEALLAEVSAVSARDSSGTLAPLELATDRAAQRLMWDLAHRD